MRPTDSGFGEVTGIFLRHVAERDGELDALEELCARHPEHADQLRRLAQDWSQLAGGGEAAAEEQPAPERDSPLRPGDRIADFRLLRQLGRGGQGSVWEAEQTSVGRRVALKLVLPERVNARNLELFRREARAGGLVAHPGIVAVHGAGQAEGLHWIAQELVPGGRTLAARVAELRASGALPADHPRAAAELVARVAEALQAAHERGVLHRDVKPSNVLLAPDGTPRLSDFGLARIAGEPGVTRTGDVVGTYSYMSPEQVSGDRDAVDVQSDVFSLGVVLYELLALRLPFEGDTTAQVAFRILRDEPPDLRAVRSRTPAELAVIAAKALEKDPRRRYPSAGELAADLRRFLQHEPIRAQPPSATTRLLKWTRRHPARSAAALVAAVAFGVISTLLVQTARARHALQEEMDAVQRLSAMQELEDLRREADAAWPVRPERIPTWRDWLSRADALVAELPAHRARLALLRQHALSQSEAERAADRERNPARAELARAEVRRAALERAFRMRWEGVEPPALSEEDARRVEAVAAPFHQLWSMTSPLRTDFGREQFGYALARWALDEIAGETAPHAYITAAFAHFAVGRDESALELGLQAVELATPLERPFFESMLLDLEERVRFATSEEGRAAAAAEIEELERREQLLAGRLDDRRTWRFPPERATERWWHDQLLELVTELELLSDPQRGLLSEEGISVEHGWSVPRRLALAEELRDATAPGGAHERRWRDASQAIRAAYPGLELAPQSGLVPLGPDPRSGLWEFWHVASGAEPVRGAGGALAVGPDTGVVLVLLPGARFTMGQTGEDGDVSAEELEAREVEVSAFFLAKHELTQGQWRRLAGSNPSRFRPDGALWGYTLEHPVETVDWQTAMRWTRRAGLTLPTEAQWEYACRAGTTGPWSFPEDARPEDHANLADEAFGRFFLSGQAFEGWDDGWAATAPVGRFRPNAFGLHDVHGNVDEWMLDGFTASIHREGPRLDPVSLPDPGGGTRIIRGGSFKGTTWFARCTARLPVDAEVRADDVGLRPARPVERAAAD